MRNPEEWNEPADASDTSHAHEVPNYTWGDNADGSTWQVGQCHVCGNEVKRNAFTPDREPTEWIVIP